MLTYDKLIIISGNRYTIRTDTITDIGTLFTATADINTTVILIIDNGPDTYAIDLSRLLTNHQIISGASNITDVINRLTPEMIYTYGVTTFNPLRVVRSFMSHDLPGRVTVTPYNVISDETSNNAYDPDYNDMRISCSDYDLTKVVPVINNKLRLCRWGGNSIILDDQAELCRTTTEMTFLSFGDTAITMSSLADIQAADWAVTPNTVVMLVLGGSLFYDVPRVYHVDPHTNTIVLNNSSIMEQLGSMGYPTISDVIADDNSFVIMVATDRLLVRQLPLVPISKDGSITDLIYHERSNHNTHMDYICLDVADNSVHGMTVVDERYQNVATDFKRTVHNVYTNGGSGNMRLFQLAIC